MKNIIKNMTEEILKANGNEAKIGEILKSNLMVSSPIGHLIAVAKPCDEYPSISVYISNDEGDKIDEITFSEMNVGEKEFVTYSYDLNNTYDDHYVKIINAKYENK